MDRARWNPLTIKELKDFLACSLYMSMKKLPNKKAYWTKLKKNIYCFVVVRLFTKNNI